MAEYTEWITDGNYRLKVIKNKTSPYKNAYRFDEVGKLTENPGVSYIYPDPDLPNDYRLSLEPATGMDKDFVVTKLPVKNRDKKM